MEFRIISFGDGHIAPAMALMRRLREAEEFLYRPITEEDYGERFRQEGMVAYAAMAGDALIGWIHGSVKIRFLPGETPENTPAYLTLLMVDPAWRRQGVGKALLDALKKAFIEWGKTHLLCSGDNPVRLAWIVPGTTDHDHNNAPGVEESCMGYTFLKAQGFADVFHEVSMYMALENYQWDPQLDEKVAALKAEGIQVGRWEPSLGDEYDEMCDRVGSEYWRNVLKHEIAARRENRPCGNPDYWADGRCPKGPRVMLTATKDGHIVGFTGPVDLQKSGRGWFSGICTDPAYGGRGIASILFHYLLQEFIAEGAVFSTLFTGQTNHAQRIYARAGMRVVANFAVMSIQLSDGETYQHTYF